jgi:parvulin-like peptidyl-prolyl isomerase
MVPREFVEESRSNVTRQFGQGFADQLDKAETGVWSGPLKSGYGAHLVLVTGRTQPRVPPLDEIRDLVEREFTNARREAAQKQFLASLLVQYDVVIEPVGEAGAAEAPGTGSR